MAIDTEPRTTDKHNVFHEPNDGYLGDFVEVLTVDGRVQYTGRIYKAHWHCPESDTWLNGQQLLGANPMRWKKCRWVSVLVHEGGAVATPDQFIRVIEPFDLVNQSSGLYFPLTKEQ